VDNLDDFIGRIRQVTGPQTSGLHEPVFAGNEKKYLAECIDSGFVSSVGSFVIAFEESVRDFVGAQHAVAVVNGTAALHLALLAVDVRPGDEVIVPAMSFVATANAVSHAGAIAHFVDVDEANWGVDPVALRAHLVDVGQMRDGQLLNTQTGRPITAVVPMHALGHPVAIAPLLAVAEEFGLVVVEDAAESLGSFVGDRHTGLFGGLGVFSFNGNKTITTGGGGVIVTDDEALAKKLKHLSTTARVPHPYEFDHDAVGYNYRMPNINAALGLAQMERLPGLIAGQRDLFELYSETFAGSRFGEVRREPTGTTSNYWLQAIALSDGWKGRKDELIRGSVDAGVSVRPMWKPLNRLAPYSSHPSAATPVTQDLYDRVICLPSSAFLAERHRQ
jgi:perosamine synthetase